MIDLVAMGLGLGILAFWAVTIRMGGLSRGAEPFPGHRRHEASFLVPDVVLALVLVASAVLSDISPPASERLRLVGAGALAFLGLLDLGYLGLTWGERPLAMRLRTGIVVVVALGGAAILAAAVEA